MECLLQKNVIQWIINENYRVLCVLGKGGYGSVYKVLNLIDDHTIAIKEIDYGEESNEEGLPTLAMIKVEIDILNQVKYQSECYPNISCYYGFEVDAKNKKAYILMEFIDGMDIRKYINVLTSNDSNLRYHIGTLKPQLLNKLLSFILTVINTINNVLIHIHKNGVLHLDIKPENILIDNNGDIKLLDFGISCAMISQDGNLFCLNKTGTPDFMAPETIIYGENYPATDIWLLGATIYSWLTGKNIWDQNNNPTLDNYSIPDLSTFFESYGRIMNSDKFKLINKIVTGCLQKDPNQRITSEEISKIVINI